MRSLEQITIRPLQESDSEPFFQMVQQNRAHLSKWLPWVDSHDSLVHSRRHISAGIVQQALRNGGQWGVFQGNQLAGEVSLHWIEKEHRSTSMGYWIGSPYLRQGIATQACELLLAHSFQELGLNRVELRAASENMASLKLALKLGFREEGCCRQLEYHHNRYWDHQILSLLREEWDDSGYRGNRNPSFSPESGSPNGL